VSDILSSRTKPVSFFSYRSVGTGSGQADFAADATASQSMFACGDVPLNSSQTATPASNPGLNIPVLVSAVSVYANIPGLRSVSVC
jgi:hypothetical protein